jgi:hypothetical protein
MKEDLSPKMIVRQPLTTSIPFKRQPPQVIETKPIVLGFHRLSPITFSELIVGDILGTTSSRARANVVNES